MEMLYKRGVANSGSWYIIFAVVLKNELVRDAPES